MSAVQASTGEVYDHLASGTVDVAIILQSRSTQKMTCERLLVEELLLVARRDHPIAKQKFVERAQLQTLTLMLPGSRNAFSPPAKPLYPLFLQRSPKPAP